MISRFIISGTTLQGVQFRETISKIAKDSGLLGQVKNLHNGDVEALFIHNNIEDNHKIIRKCFENTIKNLIGKELIDNREVDDIKLNDCPIKEFKFDNYTDPKTEDKIRKTHDFKVIREDETKEMMWALQGAGRVFLSASKKIESVLRLKKEEVTGRLNSVNRELLYAQTNIETVDDLICLKHFIADPLIFIDGACDEEQDLMRMLIEFYYEFLRYKKQREQPGDDKQILLKQIEYLQKRLTKEIREQNNKRG